jgi:hypothetical protein
MNKTHPSRWPIRHLNDEKFCQVLVLPLGKDTRSIEISTKLFNIVYREWDGSAKTKHAGDFATALRELRNADIDIAALPQVNVNTCQLMYMWLDEFDVKMDQWRIQQKESTQAMLKKIHEPEPEPEPKEEKSELYEKVLLVSITEYIKMAGPMGDAQKIADQAKAVAIGATTPS